MVVLCFARATTITNPKGTRPSMKFSIHTQKYNAQVKRVSRIFGDFPIALNVTLKRCTVAEAKSSHIFQLSTKQIFRCFRLV